VRVLDDYSTGNKLDCDLLIVGVGAPNLVNGQDIKEGCSVVDFGSTIVDRKTLGSLNYDSELGHLGLISPSPGGMGPLVIRFLIMNFLRI
jgi:methylenetetrahydrofolate dehydrogenase (NADP+)/methenyltetrahydrofolate cyclohydrolase